MQDPHDTLPPHHAVDLHLDVNSSGRISLLSRGPQESDRLDNAGELVLPPWLFEAVRQLTPPPPWVQREFKPDRDLLHLLGSTLSELLFPGRLGTWLAEQRRRTPQHPPHLRLRLAFRNPLHEALPWELCRDPSGRWLGAESNLTFTRRFYGLETLPPPLSSPLRILVLTACPSDLPPLAVQQELEGIRAAVEPWQALGRVHLTVHHQIQLEALRQLLPAHPPGARAHTEAGFHIIHFIGHGVWDPKVRRGFLLFVNARGQLERVGEDTLALLLQQHRACRLVILNACQTASGDGAELLETAALPPSPRPAPKGPSDDSGEDWVSRVHGKGVALTLLRQGGIPAVIANQHPVRDDLAEAFSRHLYQHLFRGFSIEDAIQAARRVLLETLTHREPGSLAFATPVLYLQTARAERLIRPDQTGPVTQEGRP